MKYLLAACLLLTACGTSEPASPPPQSRARSVVISAAVDGTADVTVNDGTNIRQFGLVNDTRREQVSVAGPAYVSVLVQGSTRLSGVVCSITVDGAQVSKNTASGLRVARCDAAIE